VLLPQREERMASVLRIRTKLLNILPSSDLALLQPHLVPVELPLRHYIEKPNKPIDEVCFPETAVASVVATQGDLQVEIGLIGCEGMTGTSLLLGAERPVNATFVQIAGQGLRMPTSELRSAVDKSPTMRNTFMKYVQVLVTQTAHTAVANSVGKLQERLARCSR
jgi:hypothetical protein